MFKTGPVKGNTESQQPSIKRVIEAMHRKSEAEIEKLQSRLNKFQEVSHRPLSLALDSQEQLDDIVPSKRRENFPDPAPKKQQSHRSQSCLKRKRSQPRRRNIKICFHSGVQRETLELFYAYILHTIYLFNYSQNVQYFTFHFVQ